MNGLSLQGSLCNADLLLINDFRNRVSDIHCELINQNVYVARWLKARSWDIDKAEKMFRAHIQWKNENKIDDLLNNFTPPEVLRKYLPGGICGHDKHGRPAYFCPAGTTDVFGLMKSASRSQLANTQLHLMQYLMHVGIPNQAALMRKPVDQIVVIFDLQHMNRRQLWRPWLNFVQELTTIFELNYPEVMAVCYILNVPAFFALIFSFIKPLLSKETQAKVHILGADYRDELLKQFDPENLPSHYGGTMRDPDGDPNCPSKICWGGTVPEEYYVQSPGRHGDTLAEPEPDISYNLVPIGRGGKESIFIGEAKENDTISWEFYTESNDIAFSLWVNPVEEISKHCPELRSKLTEPDRKNCETDVEIQLSPVGSTQTQELRGWLKNGVFKFNPQRSFEFCRNLSPASPNLQANSSPTNLESTPKCWRQVTQSVRVDCDLVPETGRREVDVAGSYYLIFDNSYSWTRSKRVWCRAETQTAGNISSTKSIDLSNFPQKLKTETSFLKEDVDVDACISEVMQEISNPTCAGYRSKCNAGMDVDVAALTFILVRTFVCMNRRPRSNKNAN